MQKYAAVQSGIQGIIVLCAAEAEAAADSVSRDAWLAKGDEWSRYLLKTAEAVEQLKDTGNFGDLFALTLTYDH